MIGNEEKGMRSKEEAEEKTLIVIRERFEILCGLGV